MKLDKDIITVTSPLLPDLDEFHDNFEKYAFRNLSTDTLHMINGLWEELKIN